MQCELPLPPLAGESWDGGQAAHAKNAANSPHPAKKSVNHHHFATHVAFQNTRMGCLQCLNAQTL